MVWIPKVDLRGTPGKDATGAAEDDAAIAAFAATEGTQTREVLESSFATSARLQPNTNLAVVLGNSISEQINAKENGFGWFPQLCVRSQQRIKFGGVFATGGYTIQQIRDVHLPQVLALTGWQKPGAAFLLMGTNNINPSDGNFDFAGSKAAYLEVVDALIAGGIVPIVCLDPPITNGQNNEHQWNRWLVLMCQQRGLLSPIDFYSALMDRMAGGIKAEWAQDTKHPNERGYKRMAEYALAQGVAEYFPPTPALTAVNPFDTFNKVWDENRSHFLNENSGGRALGWTTSGGTVSYALTSGEPDGVSGKWQKLIRTYPVATSGTVVFRSQSLADVYSAPGDWIEFTCRIRTSGVETTGSTVRVFANLGSTNEVRAMFDWSTDVEDGVLYGTRQIAAGSTVGSTYLNLWITDPTAAGTVEVELAEMTIRNLTTGQLLTI